MSKNGTLEDSQRLLEGKDVREQVCNQLKILEYLPTLPIFLYDSEK